MNEGLTVWDRIRDAALRRLDETLAATEALVRSESPSDHIEALERTAEMTAARFRDAGIEAVLQRPVGESRGGPMVLCRIAGPESPKPGVVLGHFDTVWPLGTLTRIPFRVQDGKAFGPGIFDMKAGLAILESAIRIMTELDLKPQRAWTCLLSPDEEIGSPTTRGAIEDLASGAEMVLVLEPAAGVGALKTARKGVGGYVIEAKGRSSHAGLAPEQGINAILELAHHLPGVSALGRPAEGTTVNIGLIQGGTARNVVPDSASAVVDVRVWTRDESRRVDDAIRSLTPTLPGAALRIQGGLNRPPMERTEASGRLFERAREIGRELGLELTETAVGGGSDANFTAALGIPTLDGLGAIGGGAHADDEHILIASLAERSALLAALLTEL